MTNPEMHHPKERMIIKGDTMQLKQLISADASAYFNLIAFDPSHLRQFGDITADKYNDSASVRQSIEHPENADKVRFGIWNEEEVVGSINLTLQEDKIAEIGYWVGKKHVGHGYAGSALTLLAANAQEKLGYNEVYCNVVVGNEASKKTVEKSGFVFERDFVDNDGIHMERYVMKSNEESKEIPPPATHLCSIAGMAIGVGG